MEFLAGSFNEISSGLRSQLFHYRYQVFVEQLGWQLKTPHGREQDQFDRQDTVYVIARNEKKQLIGCARLLPTTSAYLLEEVFPQLLNGMAPPKSPDIWELSRFTSFDFAETGMPNNSLFASNTTVELLRKTIVCAKAHGAKRIISVSPIGVERLLRKAGFNAHRAGPPMIIDGHPIFACWIELATTGSRARTALQ